MSILGKIKGTFADMTTGSLVGKSAAGGAIIGAGVGAWRDDTGVFEGALKGAAISGSGALTGKLRYTGAGAWFGGVYGAFSDNASVEQGMMWGAGIGTIAGQIPRVAGYAKAKFGNPAAAAAKEAAPGAGGVVQETIQDVVQGASSGVSAATQTANAQNAARATSTAANQVVT